MAEICPAGPIFIGDALTSSVALSVEFAPTITTQPADSTINDGATATFTAAATGNPTPTVQWQVSSDGTNWSNVSTGSGGNSDSYTTAALTSTNHGYQYRALYSNSVTANVATSAATVTYPWVPWTIRVPDPAI